MTEAVDNVNHPQHYARFRFECEPKDFTKHLPHPLASALEYYIRSPYKANELEDLQKAAWWIRELLDTDSFWEGVFSVDNKREFYFCVRLNKGEELFRYMAAAWGMAVTCDGLKIEELFYCGDPLSISRSGVKKLLENIETRIKILIIDEMLPTECLKPEVMDVN